MTDDAKREKLIRQVTKLFSLAQGRGTEEEMMSALTKAKELMVHHGIEQYELDAFAAASNQKSIDFHVGDVIVYTRKIRNLAVYDELVASCVGHLTTTRPVIYRIRNVRDERYCQVRFIGTDVDRTVAGELFMIFLRSVRARARKMYGSSRWTQSHTDYAVGFAARMADRAQQMVTTLSSEQRQTMALMVRGKETAIEAYGKEIGLKESERNMNIKDPYAYASGWIDGGAFNLSKTGLR